MGCWIIHCCFCLLSPKLLHFNKERYLLLHSLLLLLQGQWSHLPPVSRVLLALGWCLHLTWGALPWCRWWYPSSWDDASWICSWNEAAYGRPHANDAWAPNNETSCPSHDGAHPARNDPTRQIRRLGCFFISVLYYLYFTRSWCCDSGCFLTAWQGKLVPPS